MIQDFQSGLLYSLKMLGLYLLGQNCLHLTFEQYLGRETYSRKYEILPNIVILACKNITENIFLLKMSGPQIWLCLFTFFIYVIASKQLNGLTTIDTVSCLGSAVVSALGARGPGFNPHIRQRFLCFIFCFVVVVFLFFCKKTHIICHKSLQFLLQC